MHVVNRCKQWVAKCRTHDLDSKTVDELNRNYVVCAKHFEDCMFMNSQRKKLVHNAVPTVFAFNQPTAKRKAPCDRSLSVVDKKSKHCSEHCSFADTRLEQQLSSVQ